jgi:hypothetical protein
MKTQYKLQTSEIVNDKLLFDNHERGFLTALNDGFFFLKMPEELDLSGGDLFATNFYKNKEGAQIFLDQFRGFKQYTPDKLDKHEGYYCREVDQTEQFFLERRFWHKIYPLSLIDLAEKLKTLSIIILHNILSELGIPKEIWGQATGGCSDNTGMYHLTFNHFRPEKEARGLNIHKDSGWVTILRSIEPGLEAYINDQWLPITPKPGYFIVNFGCAFEILTKNMPQPVNAITHRVVQQTSFKQQDRFSYALFADSSLNEELCKGLYEYDIKNGLVLKINFNTFLDNILKATYQEDTVGLY